MEREDGLRLVGPWPKADLHCHLDGSLRPETLAELAAERGGGLASASPEAVRSAVQMGTEPTSLETYLDAFRLTLAVLQTASALRRVAREIVEDADDENVRLLELRFCPFLHGETGLRARAAVDAVLEGLAEASSARGVRAGLILCAMRERDPAEGERLVDIALDRRANGVVAVDLAGPEAGYPPGPWSRAFRRARSEGLGVTVHAGEAAGPASVWSALQDTCAIRIGHACRAAEDPELLDALAAQRIVVEACPTSNLQTGAVRSLAAHPLGALRDAGVEVTVATDNRLVSGTTVTEELARVAASLALDAASLRAIVLAGFEGAFLDASDREALLEEVRAAIPAER